MPKHGTQTELPSAFSTERLERNLAALKTSDPQLSARLCEPVDASVVRFRADGEVDYVLHRNTLQLSVTHERSEALVRGVGEATRVLVLGVGLGEVIEGLLGKAGIRRVTAWDRDPWLLRLFLMRVDVSAALLDNRLRLALSVDLLRISTAGCAVVRHPLLARIYAAEIRLLEEGVSGGRVMLGTGGLFVDQVRRGLEARGLSVWTLDLERLSRAELDLAVRRFRPRCLVAINYTEGLVEFCREYEIELLCWEIDPTTAPLRPVTGSTRHAHVFTYRRRNVAAFRWAGFAHAEYLPLAADPDVRAPVGLSADKRTWLSAPVAFVGSSMMENAVRCRGVFHDLWRRTVGGRWPEEGERVLAHVLATQRADFTRYRLPELLTERARAFLEAARQIPGAEDPVLLAAEAAASEKRLTYAAHLGSLGLSVWGDPGWRCTEEAGVRYMGRAGHERELTQVYNATDVHVDLGRLYQQDIVTMRVFDVLACGKLVLAEHSPELEELFEVGVEVDAYRDRTELAAKVEFYLARPEEARRIAARGQAAVRERHTIEQRLELMFSRVEAVR